MDCAFSCDRCGRFVSPMAAGVSWSQSWGYCMDGSPDLYDPTYRCSPCTDKHGVKPTNCAPGYPGNGRNALSAINPAESDPSGRLGNTTEGNPATDEPQPKPLKVSDHG